MTCSAGFKEGMSMSHPCVTALTKSYFVGFFKLPCVKNTLPTCKTNPPGRKLYKINNPVCICSSIPNMNYHLV